MTERRGEYDVGREQGVPFEIEKLELFQWHPTPDPAMSAPEQVHLVITTKGGPIEQFVFRFKGTETLDQLVDNLVMHRTEVWGPRDYSAD